MPRIIDFRTEYLAHVYYSKRNNLTLLAAWSVEFTDKSNTNGQTNQSDGRAMLSGTLPDANEKVLKKILKMAFKSITWL